VRASKADGAGSPRRRRPGRRRSSGYIVSALPLAAVMRQRSPVDSEPL
jgi:hypothetical protein